MAIIPADMSRAERGSRCAQSRALGHEPVRAYCALKWRLAGVPTRGRPRYSSRRTAADTCALNRLLSGVRVLVANDPALLIDARARPQTFPLVYASMKGKSMARMKVRAHVKSQRETSFSRLHLALILVISP